MLDLPDPQLPDRPHSPPEAPLVEEVAELGVSDRSTRPVERPERRWGARTEGETDMGLRDRIQLTQARRAYKNDPQAKAELDRLNDRAEADPRVTKEMHLGAERRIIAASRQRNS